MSGLFVDDLLGRFPGTLPLTAINMKGSALTPMPAIAVNFRTFSTGCEEPRTCAVEIADTGLQQGQGMHGSFSRADTMNFMAAIGPDFKTGFTDEAPASNADVGKTRLTSWSEDHEQGKIDRPRPTEAMPGGATPRYVLRVIRSGPAAGGIRTVINYQLVGNTILRCRRFSGKNARFARDEYPCQGCALIALSDLRCPRRWPKRSGSAESPHAHAGIPSRCLQALRKEPASRS